MRHLLFQLVSFIALAILAALIVAGLTGGGVFGQARAIQDSGFKTQQDRVAHVGH